MFCINNIEDVSLHRKHLQPIERAYSQDDQQANRYSSFEELQALPGHSLRLKLAEDAQGHVLPAEELRIRKDSWGKCSRDEEAIPTFEEKVSQEGAAFVTIFTWRNVQRSLHNSTSLPKLELSEIIKMNPQKIDLLKKYRSKIHGKLSVFREAEEISKTKEVYNEWYDSVKNSPLKSPMFNKVHISISRWSICLRKWIRRTRKMIAWISAIRSVPMEKATKR